MSHIKEMLEHNKNFVDDGQHEAYRTDKLPSKKIAILSCMDTRLTELLLAALNFKNGEIKVIKNAGAVITHPFGSVMRSLLVAVYNLGVEEIIVIGHHDCGMQNLDPQAFILQMLDRGIPREKIDMARYCGLDIDKWLKGFNDVETSVAETVAQIKNHPFMPKDILVHGFIIDPETGKLEEI